MKKNTPQPQTPDKKIENELQALRNALDHYNLTGYTVHQWYKATYHLTDDKGASLTGAWDYVQLNHFIMGYAKALKIFAINY